ncbi:mucin-15 [Triplophysa dalaica]|uniref:mucin-15 n=1 Tax=Triplophysa dalaica TaxID=1582913 RepID=UPI0024DF8F2F|nr:mucin-15 [Triplophysa dalaica]
MKLPMGITLTLTLLLLLQNLQQVSTDIPDSWERVNDITSENDNGGESFQEETNTKPTGENYLGDVNTQVTPQNSESSSEKEGKSYGSFNIGNEQQDQNPAATTPMPPAAGVLPYNETEVGNSESPATTTPPQTGLNSSSDLSETSAEHNDTETQETTPNPVTSEPTQTTEADLYGTHADPKPENTTGDSSHYETGSGYIPSEAPAENPTTTTEAPEDQENMQNVTTVKPSEPPAYRTTKRVTPPAIPEMETTAADIENTEIDLNGSSDIRGDLAKGLTSDGVQDTKKNQGWGVILVVGIIVAVIALTAFLVLNRRNRRDFTHRKLVEDVTPDPVLRLDNSEPLDFGYYNPGLQGDNIRMTNFPQGRTN